MTCSTASNSGKFAWSGVGIEEGTTLKGITFRLSDFFFDKGLENESGFFIATPCIPEKIINVMGTTIMWDTPVITERTILASQPGIILHD